MAELQRRDATIVGPVRLSLSLGMVPYCTYLFCCLHMYDVCVSYLVRSMSYECGEEQGEENASKFLIFVIGQK